MSKTNKVVGKANALQDILLQQKILYQNQETMQWRGCQRLIKRHVKCWLIKGVQMPATAMIIKTQNAGVTLDQGQADRTGDFADEDLYKQVGANMQAKRKRYICTFSFLNRLNEPEPVWRLEGFQPVLDNVRH